MIRGSITRMGSEPVTATEYVKLAVLAALLGTIAALLGGCTQADDNPPDTVQQGEGLGGTTVERVVDTKYGVVCYVSDGYNSGGISCLPLK